MSKEYDRKVLRILITDYCRAKHGGTELCPACASLEAYAFDRIEKCPLGTQKTVCQKCAIHCYSPVKREQVKEVMRFSGKRLLLRHPVMALRHLFILLSS